jgi:hypothetical protein
MNSLLHARPLDSVVERIRFSQHDFGLLDHSRLIEYVAVEELVHVGYNERETRPVLVDESSVNDRSTLNNAQESTTFFFDHSIELIADQ